MTEQAMLSKDAFIDFILNGPDSGTVQAWEAAAESALPEGFEGFGRAGTHSVPSHSGSSFARRLLEASGFGYAEMVQRDNVIRSTDAVARYLPSRVSFWPKTTSRAYQTLLFEADLTHRQLLAIPAFRTQKMAHLDIVEDALARLVSEALDGFQRGGEGVTADVRRGRKEETLCVVSIVDEREEKPVRLVCFGTQNDATGGLETFQITEQARFWDPKLAREHLGLLYERQFKKLEGHDWQEAFTTTEERKQAENLLEICTRKSPKEHDIQEGALDLLDIVAKSFGLRKKPKTDRRLQAFELPSDHDIGIDPDERESSFGGTNPFGGVTLRDDRSRLLGYIVYPLETKADAARLRKHLEANNRFHNVLVVYPHQDQASLELWQGREQLSGKLRKGQGYKDAADVVNLLSRFFVVSKAKVRNPTELAQELAYRARYLRRLAVKQLEDEPEKGPLRNLYNAFKDTLVHDQTEEQFADAFSQTLTYSLLTARWVAGAQGSDAGARFSRKVALQKLALGSRFLGELFSAVLSMRIEEHRARLLWLVDDLADLLDRVDVVSVFQNDGSDVTADPVIHFYEPFLEEYDPHIRRQRGVFYTPRAVVSFIVRTVDDILRTEFGLADGLADTSSWADMAERRSGITVPAGVARDEPFVQILDPASGTGTFLVEVVDQIHRTLTERWNAQGYDQPKVRSMWSAYVSSSLLPRLYGYELLMAPYAVAHLRLALKLQETHYDFRNYQGARVYLTNSLEPHEDRSPKLAFEVPALAEESDAVRRVKRSKRFTVVIGNPPYSGFSANMAEYAQGLVDAYKVLDGKPLGERKLWLQDDYVKFFRQSQLWIESTNVGVMGLITAHGYLTPEFS